VNPIIKERLLKAPIKAIVTAVAVATLSGCTTDSSMDTATSRDDNLSGTRAQFDMVEEGCISEASRMTGAHPTNIYVTKHTRTGGGPLLSLSVGGIKYRCRLGNDGSATVFREFAN
jgi:hypothetical protein